MSGPNYLLSLYVVYERPLDFPNEFVVRKYVMSGLGNFPTASSSVVLRSVEYEPIKEALGLMGLYCLGRDQHDDPVIKESWV